MRTLHGYLTRQVLGSLALSVAVLTFVFLLVRLLKQLLGLLVGQQANLLLVGEAILLLLPYVLVFALPFGMLTATILVFGRLSAEQELTAVRASGISLLALARPILGLGLAMTAFCAWMNLEIAPRSRLAFRELLDRIGLEQSANFLENMERRILELDPYVIYVGKVTGTNLSDILLYQIREGETILNLTAERGHCSLDKNAGRLQFVFQNVTVILKPDSFLSGATNVASEAPVWQPILAEEWPVAVPLPSQQRRRSQRLADMTFSRLAAERERLEQLKINISPVLVEMHRQAAFSFASISFTLIGIPLGIRAHRKETNIGIAIALGLLLVYYSFIILGQALETKPQYFPHLILWAPNFLFQIVGAILLWRANRN